MGQQPDPDIMLTRRERELLRLLSLGCTVKEVATILGISRSTADNHKSRMMRKLGIRKAVLLPRVAIKLGISSVNDRLTNLERFRLESAEPPELDSAHVHKLVKPLSRINKPHRPPALREKPQAAKPDPQKQA